MFQKICLVVATLFMGSLFSAPYEIAGVIDEAKEAIPVHINDLNQVVGRYTDGGSFFWSEESGCVDLEKEVSFTPLINNQGTVLLKTAVSKSWLSADSDKLFYWSLDRGFEEISPPSVLTFKSYVPLAMNDLGEFVVVDAENWNRVQSEYIYKQGSWRKIREIRKHVCSINNATGLLHTISVDYTQSPAIYYPFKEELRVCDLPFSLTSLGMTESGDIYGFTQLEAGSIFNFYNGTYVVFSGFIPRRMNNEGEALGVHPDDLDSEHQLIYRNTKSNVVLHLQELVDTSEAELLWLTDINDHGWILAVGKLNEKVVGLVLRPSN